MLREAMSNDLQISMPPCGGVDGDAAAASHGATNMRAAAAIQRVCDSIVLFGWRVVGLFGKRQKAEGRVQKPVRFNAAIEEIEAKLLCMPQVDMPVVNRFAPDVYMREIFMPKDTFVIGHQHKTEHFNVVLTGRATVYMAGEIAEVVAPCVFVSKPGVRKVLFIHEDMKWATVHPTKETDLDKLDEQLIIKSHAWTEHQKQIEGVAELQKHLQQSTKGELWHGQQ